jgi:hypothetical protein
MERIPTLLKDTLTWWGNCRTMKVTNTVDLHLFMSKKAMRHCDVADDWIARQSRSTLVYRRLTSGIAARRLQLCRSKL